MHMYRQVKHGLVDVCMTYFRISNLRVAMATKKLCSPLEALNTLVYNKGNKINLLVLKIILRDKLDLVHCDTVIDTLVIDKHDIQHTDIHDTCVCVYTFMSCVHTHRGFEVMVRKLLAGKARQSQNCAKHKLEIGIVQTK